MKQNLKGLALILAACFTVTACGSFKRIDATMEKSSDDYAAGLKQIQEVRSIRPEPVKIVNKPWVSTTPIIKATRDDYPAALQCPISLARQDAVSIYEFAQIITDECNVPVRVTPDAMLMLNGGYGTGSAGGAQAGSSGLSLPIARPGPMPLPPLPTASAMPMAFSTSNAATNSGDPYLRGIFWAGKPLAGLLDSVTARLGLSWAYRDNAVHIYYVDTRVFKIAAISSKTTMEYVVQSGTSLAGGSGGATGAGGVGGGSGGSNVAGGSNQTTKVAIEASLMDDIKTTLEAMVTPGGIGRVAIGSNSVTVTDTPASLGRIAEYMERENRNITRQAIFNVTVASVTLTDTDGFGLDLGLVYQALSGNYGINLANAFSAGTGAASASLGVLDTATGGAARFSGSRAILSALSNQGRVSVLTNPTVTTLNMQPVPVQIAKQTSYLASVSTTNTAQVGSTATLTPGTVTTGFSMDLLPYLMDNNEMLLQFTMNLSPDARLRSAESGDNRIEVPEIDSRIFSQRVKMTSGQTLVLSGFEQRVSNGTKSGVGSPDNWFFGGGGTSDGRREVIVILITPIILDQAGVSPKV